MHAALPDSSFGPSASDENGCENFLALRTMSAVKRGFSLRVVQQQSQPLSARKRAFGDAASRLNAAEALPWAGATPQKRGRPSGLPSLPFGLAPAGGIGGACTPGRAGDAAATPLRGAGAAAARDDDAAWDARVLRGEIEARCYYGAVTLHDACTTTLLAQPHAAISYRPRPRRV